MNVTTLWLVIDQLKRPIPNIANYDIFDRYLCDLIGSRLVVTGP